MSVLENPKENPCWGCGPLHARGIHVTFEREGDMVVATKTPREDEIGWPGLVHTGIHYSTLFEACFWAAWELTGQVHIVSGTQSFHQDRLPRTGRPFKAIARIVARDPLVMRAESVNADGKPCAWLEATFVPASRAQVERAGIKLPAYVTDEMAP